MVLANFQVEDKFGKARFFQETFSLANISVEVVLSMLFLILSNANVQFVEKKLTWRSYTTTEALPTSKQVEPINKIKFAKATLVETFVVHIVFFNLIPRIHPDRVV